MHALKQWIKKYFAFWIYKKNLSRKSFESFKAKVPQGTLAFPSQASANLFTYHGEDGILYYLVEHIRDIPKQFVDIGSGNCIKSNCALLAVHEGWKGVFIDADPTNLAIGKNFYGKQNLASNFDFVHVFVTPENINGILSEKGVAGNVGVLSIDIDGNDFWIWDAVEVIKPKIVVIEVKVEFGERNVVVPYRKETHYKEKYNGASVEAIRRLAHKKGYALVAANKQGYNLFFVQKDDLPSMLRVWNTGDVLQDEETKKSFYEELFFDTHEFIKVEAYGQDRN